MREAAAHQQDRRLHELPRLAPLQRGQRPHLSESRPEVYTRLEAARHKIAAQDLAKH